LGVWDRFFYSFVFKECLKNLFQLSGRKETERKREQRERVEIFEIILAILNATGNLHKYLERGDGEGRRKKFCAGYSVSKLRGGRCLFRDLSGSYLVALE